MRTLVKVYDIGVQGEDMPTFIDRAMNIVRLFYEESFVRSLTRIEGHTVEERNLRRSAFCSLAVTMRNIEMKTLGMKFEEKGMFSHLH